MFKKVKNMAIDRERLSKSNNSSVLEVAEGILERAWAAGEVDPIEVAKYRGAVVVDISGEMTFVYDVRKPDWVKTVFVDKGVTDEVLGATRARLDAEILLKNPQTTLEQRGVLVDRITRLKGMLVRSGRSDIAQYGEKFGYLPGVGRKYGK